MNKNEPISLFTDNGGCLLFGLGTSQIASLGRRLRYEEALNLFETAFQNNVRIIDTADTYGSGDSEYLIGKVLKDLNINPFIITKAGLPYVSGPRFISPLNQIAKKIKQVLRYRRNYNSAYLIESISRSLKRLKKKQIGAFLLHEPIWDEIKLTDCWEALSKIKEAGLTLFTGVSSRDIEVVRDGILSGQVNIVQTSVQFDNENSKNIIKLCESNKIPVIANEVFLPFNSGMYNIEKVASESRKLPGLGDIEPFQLLLGITYFDTKVKSILIGTRNVQHLVQNIQGRNFFPAIKDYLNEIRNIFNDNKKH